MRSLVVVYVAGWEKRPACITVIGWAWIIIGFTAFFIFDWISMSSGEGLSGIDIMAAIMGVVIMSIYGVPLGIMLKYLRSPKIRDAITGNARQLG